ncbi:MAG: DUF302 domain-containing protein [Pseudomonadota bacterium]
MLIFARRAAVAALFSIVASAAPLSAIAAETGLVRVSSPHSPTETINRLEAAVEKAGARVFARVDHGAGAESVGQPVGDNVLLIFGNPKLGTPFIAASGSVGLDLPLRVVAYETAEGTEMLYYAPEKLAEIHGIPADHPTIAAMRGALGKLTAAAAAE